LLSLSYIESLFFDTVANTKYAKYYNNLLENDHSHIATVIAYERKAQRLMDIGMKNQSVEQLFNMNKQQKKDLIQMQSELQQSLKKNLERNAEIFKQP
jgi:transposase-like protein